MPTRDERKKSRQIAKANVKRGTQVLVDAEGIKRRKAKKVAKVAYSLKDNPKKSEYSDRITKASVKIRQGKDKKSLAEKDKKTAGYKITRNGKTYTGKVGDEQYRKLTKNK